MKILMLQLKHLHGKWSDTSQKVHLKKLHLHVDRKCLWILIALIISKI